MNPLMFIETLRNSDPYIQTIYTNGGCYAFYKVLKSIYPEAKPYINREKDHVVTVIDGASYDINGHTEGQYAPLVDEVDIARCESWGFSKWRFIGEECPFCEEVLPLTTQ